MRGVPAENIQVQMPGLFNSNLQSPMRQFSQKAHQLLWET